MLSVVFRAKFVEGLRTLHRKGKLSFAGASAELRNPKRFAIFLDKLFEKDWIVYANPAFGGPARVLRYLGRYTHRVAISNHRLLSFDGERVTFRWRDYAHGNKQKEITLTALEFLGRLSHHILPHGFVRIRHFGFLTNTRRSALLTVARQLIAGGLPSVAVCSATVVDPDSTWQCPHCHSPMRIGPNLSALQLRSQCTLSTARKFFPAEHIDASPCHIAHTQKCVCTGLKVCSGSERVFRLLIHASEITGQQRFLGRDPVRSCCMNDLGTVKTRL